MTDRPLILPRIGFGGAGLAGVYAATAEDDAQAMLAAAWGAGIRYFDTAPFYGSGLSEQRLCMFLATKPRADVILSTKVGRLIEAGKVRFDYSGNGILRSIADSQTRLGLDHFDMVFVHDIGTFGHAPDAARAHMADFLSTGLPALLKLKSDGVVGGFGLGVNEVAVCLEVLNHADLDVILLAGRYTLLDRTAEAELLPLCLKRGTKVIAAGVYNSGILAAGPNDALHFNYAPATDDIVRRVRGMSDAAAQHGISLAQAALNFPLSHPAISTVLIGSDKLSTLNANFALIGSQPDAAFLAEIEPFVLR